jgi:hypothetical protein
MDDPFKHATLGAGVFYSDPIAALGWLEQAFGFRRSILVTDRAGNLVPPEMRFADAYIIVEGGPRMSQVLLRSAERTRRASTFASAADWTSIARGLGRQAPRSSRSRPTNPTASAPTVRATLRVTSGPLPRRSGRCRGKRPRAPAAGGSTAGIKGRAIGLPGRRQSTSPEPRVRA